VRQKDHEFKVSLGYIMISCLEEEERGKGRRRRSRRRKNTRVASFCCVRM
jgi:hypothetical protein